MMGAMAAALAAALSAAELSGTASYAQTQGCQVSSSYVKIRADTLGHILVVVQLIRRHTRTEIS